jgi:TolA-binding protein
VDSSRDAPAHVVAEPASPSQPQPPAAAIQLAPPATPALPSATEQHFQRGTQLLRDGKPADAAAELALAADASSDPLATDARYFQAVALVKANRPAEAERAVLAFLDHAPTSPRRGRAAVMLGRLLATHDQGSARAWFAAALHDSDASVAAAARAGLDSLGAH